MLIRRAHQTWHPPETESFVSEAELQEFLRNSPELLPGTDGGPLILARELPIPPTGSVDMIAITLDGNIRLIECKLVANPQIRREVVGQILAYASGLWQRTFEQLSLAYQTRTGVSLIEDAVVTAAAAGVDDFDPVRFRAEITSRLESGTFQLIIAVDAITDELKRIVTFLNQHTNQAVSVLALELTYLRDEDVEVLVPATYGGEAIRQKAGLQKQWTEQEFLAFLEEHVDDPLRGRMLRLIEHAENHPSSHDFYWGNQRFWWGQAQYPRANAWFKVNGRDVGVWTMRIEPPAAGRAGDPISATKLGLVLNVDWIQRAADESQLADLVATFRGLPGVAPLFSELEQKQWRKRPTIPLRQLLANDQMVDVVSSAIDRLVATKEVSPFGPG